MSAERWIVIPRWDEFQHRDVARSDREPKWIKTFTRLLHDDDYLNLTQSQRGILHGLWLLYASQRRVVGEAGARRMLVRSDAEARHWRGNLEALNHAGFIEFSASKPRAACQQVASLDVDVDREKSKSKSKTPRGDARARDHDDDIPLDPTDDIPLQANGHHAHKLAATLAAKIGTGLDFQ